MATSLGTNSRVKPNLTLFKFLCYNLINKNKRIKDGNTCIYVLLLLYPFLNVSGEISPNPNLRET